MKMMNKADALLISYKELDWDSYVAISQKLTEIDTTNLEHELQEQASRFAYYNGLFEVAKKELEKATTEYDNFVAKTSYEEEERRRMAGTKFTVRSIENFVRSLPKHERLLTEIRTIKFKFGLLKGLAKAMEQRKDMLVQHSILSRSEANLYNKF